jgi:monoamine oxidase
MKRRHFIKTTVAATGILPAFNACKSKRLIKGSIIGSSVKIGHLIKDKHFDQPTEIITKDVVIIGGGVSGLSAGRWLKNSGIEDFFILDLEKDMGGNAANGANEISSFPWGAHYIPTPNNDLKEYLDFLKESNVITGYDTTGLPVYNEYFLCADPQERLYINGSWQDGLIPYAGLPDNDKVQIKLFMERMNSFRFAKGKDGRDAFTIPVDNSSHDNEFTVLDTLTMKEWLVSQQLESKYLHWYVNYCTRDDFGTVYDKISAWAGIHYFAARKGKGANAQSNDVLTWPEGNGFLVKNLSKSIVGNFLNNSLAVNISTVGDEVRIKYLDVVSKNLKTIEAKFAIVCTPQFVNSRMLPMLKERSDIVSKSISYSPWMVANLTVKGLVERTGAPFSWDNVLYDSASLGYVNATQQLIQQKAKDTRINLTYYLPLTTAATAAEERTKAIKVTHEEWVARIIEDLKVPHPNIEVAIEKVDIMVWGHAMAQPLPGMIHGKIRKQLKQPVNNKIFFAHTDLAGISVFEEAFYQGIDAARQVVKLLES